MGSPLAPVLANIFMSFYESKWLNESNLNKPKFYLRYVDDTLAAFGRNKNEYNLNKPKFYLRYVDDTLAAFGKERDSFNFLFFF